MCRSVIILCFFFVCAVSVEGQQAPLVSAEVLDAGPVPGLDKVGMGFDAIKGEFTQPLIAFGEKSVEPWLQRGAQLGSSTTTRYQVPQGVALTSVAHVSTVGTDLHTVVVQGLQSFRAELARRAGVVSPSPALFQLSSELDRMRDALQDKVYVLAEELHPLYTLRLEQEARVKFSIFNLFSNLTVDIATMQSSKKLPSELLTLFRNLGTHYVSSATFGGQLRTEYFMDRQYSTTMTTTQLRSLCEADLKNLLGCRYATAAQMLPSQLDTFHMWTSRTLSFRGGQLPAMGSLSCDSLEAWLASLASDPVQLSFSLSELHELVPADLPMQRAAVKAGLELFMEKSAVLAQVQETKTAAQIHLSSLLTTLGVARATLSEAEHQRLATAARTQCHLVVDQEIALEAAREDMYGGVRAALDRTALQTQRCAAITTSLPLPPKGRCITCAHVFATVRAQAGAAAVPAADAVPVARHPGTLELAPLLYLSPAAICGDIVRPVDAQDCQTFVRQLAVRSALQFELLDLLKTGCRRNASAGFIDFEAGDCPALVACQCLGQCDAALTGAQCAFRHRTPFDECNDVDVPGPDCEPEPAAAPPPNRRHLV
eukprot:gnl/Spiro4/26565_TR13230_c0_g1_i1.p1 gnl/Spiro4/26565_TR13230_c0_g1~~gnl/Spiro4/26565_TR13230_c0_g1_i1.p1  ORF type:complete len:599 (+),score=204.31 gnl/Spiro4/26565_TR13230_c0_g1_i1:47-1843(+)